MRRTAALATLMLALSVAQGAAQTRVGDFFHVSVTDPMSDRDLSYVSTLALGRAPGTGDAYLLWQCSGSVIEVVLEAPELAGLTGPIPVRWRFDDTPASDREVWRVSTLQPRAYAPESTIYPFSEVATTARAVLLRAEDAEGRWHDYRFGLAGLNNSLNRLGCARHLEVLGQRRAMALFERASLNGEEALDEGGIHRLIEQFRFVGHRTQRRYLASSDTCWRILWKVDEVVFFRVERDARAGGYARGGGCAP
jgi:hypothetical protein